MKIEAAMVFRGQRCSRVDIAGTSWRDANYAGFANCLTLELFKITTIRISLFIFLLCFIAQV